MIDKQEIKCLKKLKEGPFFTEYLVKFDSNIGKRRYFKLRVMSKQLIVKNKVDEEMVLNELKIRTNLRHYFLVNQVCAFQDYNNLFYITEYTPLKLLKNETLKPPFHYDVVRFFSAEIFLALKYMHNRHQIYTFLSPENIYLDEDGHIKLDYSFCNCLNERDNEVLDMIEFASLDYLYHHDFTKAGDYWSYGIVIYLMAVGYTPFGSENYEQTIISMQRGIVEFPENFDTDLSDFIRSFLQIDINSRLGSSLLDVQKIMNHSFFKNIDWEAIEKRKILPPYIPKFNFPDQIDAPSLCYLYTSDYIVGEKDGYGDTFSKYNSTYFLINK